jgi:hypothetical protein
LRIEIPEGQNHAEEILTIDSRGKVATDLPLQNIVMQRRVELRIETPEGRKGGVNNIR